MPLGKMKRTRTNLEPPPTDEERDHYGRIVLELERNERGNPDWVPTYLNGGYQFSERVWALIAERRKT